MKFHRTLVQAVVETLQQIFIMGVYADKAVEHVLKQNPRWGARDRRFIAETTYEMVRWWRKLCIIYSENEQIEARNYYKLFAIAQLMNGYDLPEWQEFSDIDKSTILTKVQNINTIRKYRESIPDWLDDIASKELGENVWEQELTELNKEAKVVLRVNTLKTSLNELKNRLQFHSIEAETLDNAHPLWQSIQQEALVVKRQNLTRLQEYKHGLFEIQDASSQLVAPFMQLQENMTVIDACAGAGGKSLHIAALMKNKGKIISMDVEENKLWELKKRASRAGVSIIQTQLINNNTIAALYNTADRLLLDVPCSGLGVLKRNADAKWKLTPQFIEQIKHSQQHILSTYSPMLKPGGIMVYATCSILPSENQNQVTEFLNSNTAYELLEDKKILPSYGFDGFYMAAIKKFGH